MNSTTKSTYPMCTRIPKNLGIASLNVFCDVLMLVPLNLAFAENSLDNFKCYYLIEGIFRDKVVVVMILATEVVDLVSKSFHN
jgi:hypothetical protein